MSNALLYVDRLTEQYTKSMWDVARLTRERFDLHKEADDLRKQLDAAKAEIEVLKQVADTYKQDFTAERKARETESWVP